MPRRRRDTTFRRTDFIRGVKAARDAGIPNPCVVIDCMNRTMTIMAGSPAKRADADNPLDQWIASRADQTEGD
jgi:hypothetical protein